METPRRRWLVAVAMLLGGVAAGSVTTWLVLMTPLTFGGDARPAVEDPPASFSVTGDIAEPFQPGASAAVDAVISNPLTADLTIFEVRIEIDEVDAPAATDQLPCTPDDFEVEQLDVDEFVVAARSSVSLTEAGVPADRLPRVTMLDTATNQDGCKGASITLAYSAVGRIVE
jgi:hypothetical protein